MFFDFKRWFVFAIFPFLSSCFGQADLDIDPKMIATGMKALVGVIDSLQMSLDNPQCIYACPLGRKKIANRSHSPSSNGCGSLGVEVDLSHMSLLSLCCDSHDLCYDTCSSSKNKCDKDFRQCLKNTCSSLPKKKKSSKDVVFTIDACMITADVIYGGVTVLGCKSFIDAQKKACSCVLKRATDDL